jgi:hypothetical protein
VVEGLFVDDCGLTTQSLSIEDGLYFFRGAALKNARARFASAALLLLAPHLQECNNYHGKGLA